jgi:hypothetical protein
MIIYSSSGVQKVDLFIDDKTVLAKKLMAEDKITCPVTVNSVLSIAIGDYVTFQGSNYYINRYPSITKVSEVEYQYVIVFEGEIYSLLDLLFLNVNTRQSEWGTYGTLDYFLGLVCTLVGFTKINVKITDPKIVNFAGISCREVLSKLALEFDAEFSVNGKVISFPAKVSQDRPELVFQHGVNAGLYTLTRESIDDGNTVTRAYVFGSTRNLTFNYPQLPIGRTHSPRLLMPIDAIHAPLGYIQDLTHYPKIVEKNVIFEDIYPHFTGTITDVSLDYLSVTCLGIDFDLTAYFIDQINAKIVFLSGQLLGTALEIPPTGYNALTKTITFNRLVQTDGNEIPSKDGKWKPVIGDTFTLIDIKMPQSYIDAAELALFVAGRDWLDYYSQLRIVYKLQLDPRYLRANLITLHIGDIVTVIDSATGTNVPLRVNSLNISIKYPERVTAEITNYADETYERKVSTQISDTLAKISEIKAENSTVSGVSRHWTYNPDLLRLESDCDVFIFGQLGASKEVVAWMAGAVTSDVLANLTATYPLVKTSASNLALNINSTQFEIVGNALQIKSGVLVPVAHAHVISDVTGLQTALNNKLETSLKGAINGLAELGSNGIILSTQLPSYVSDVVYANSFATLPASGLDDKIYITRDTGVTYRWAGTSYVEISASLALGETALTAFRGDWGLIAYNHSQSAHNYLPNRTFGTAANSAIGDFQEKENQRLSSGNSPAFAALNVSSLINLVNNNSQINFASALSSDLYLSCIPGTRIVEIRNWNITTPGYADCGLVTGTGDFRNLVTATGLQVNGTANVTGVVSALDGNSTQWNTAYTKTLPFTVTGVAGTGTVTIDRNLSVTGNITASQDVIAYVASAVTSDVLANLTAILPLTKPTTSSVGLNYGSQFEVIGGALQIKSTAFGGGTSNLALGETASTAFRGDWGLIAYNHSQSAHNYLPTRTFGTAANSAIGDFQEKENQRLSSGNSPAFAALNVSSLISLVNNNSQIQFASSTSSDLYLSCIPGTRIVEIRNWNITTPGYADCGLVTGTGDFRNLVTATGLQVNGAANVTGVIASGGTITANTSYIIKNSAGVTKWTVNLGASDVLEFKNASGVIKATIDQAGNLIAKGEVTAFG